MNEEKPHINPEEEQEESVWDKITLEQEEQLRQELKEIWEKRGFIFFDNPHQVPLKDREGKQSDFKAWEVVAIRQRRTSDSYTSKEIIHERGGVEFLVWKPKQTQEGDWFPRSNIEPRHLIELDQDWRPDNDLTWVRSELEDISKNRKEEEIEYLKREMSETMPDKDRREWVEKRVLIEKYKKDWLNKSLELLEREDLSLMEKWKSEAVIVLQQYKAMGPAVKLKMPYTVIHEELIKIQIVRDFYWHLSELSSNTKDDLKKDEYTQKTVEVQKLIDEYNRFIEEKKIY